MDSGSSQDRCSCSWRDKDTSQESDNSSFETHTPNQTIKQKKNKISLFDIKRARSQLPHFKRSKKSSASDISPTGSSPSTSMSLSLLKKYPRWALKFNCARRDSRASVDGRDDESSNCCRCTCYRKVDENGKSIFTVDHGASSSKESSVSSVSSEAEGLSEAVNSRTQKSSEIQSGDPNQSGIYGTANSENLVISVPFIDAQWMRTIHEDCDEAARIARAREIEQGVDPPANFRSVRRLQLLCSGSETESSPSEPPRRLQLVCPPDLSVESLKALFQNHVTLRSCPLDTRAGCHTQVDFIHCLVPDLMSITNCSFYWGKMDRYEAERLLENKPEGTFLLRDSAQEEFLFSVSFRKYGRSLHARIEQWNHKFSFDCHDPGVYTSDTVCGLIEHYKDPASCMFFEPVLTWPLHRNFTFSLQHMARAAIVSRLTYDNINLLNLPKSLKAYLKEYHYRQKVRVERFDDDVQWLEVRNVSP